MIQRISDDSSFHDERLIKLAEKLQSNKKKLFDIANSENDAKRVQKELNVNGYQSSYEKVSDNVYKVYFYENIPQYKNDIKSSKDEHNSYSNFNKVENSGKYDFDDGSLWKVMVIGGIPYLTKNIDDKNNIIRTKTASVTNEKMAVRTSSFIKISKIIFNDFDDNMIKAIFNDNVFQEKFINSVFSLQLNKKIANAIHDNKFIITESLMNELKNTILSSNINTKADFINVIYDFCNKNVYDKRSDH